jgi:hypothetical protein
MTHFQIIGNNIYNNLGIDKNIVRINAKLNILTAINILLDKIPSFTEIWFIGFSDESCQEEYDDNINLLQLSCERVGINFYEKKNYQNMIMK